MEILKIKETCVYVDHLDEIKNFYETILGLPVISYLKDKHIFFRAGSSVLLFFNPEDSRKKVSPPSHHGGGNQHFAFEVRKEDYDKVKTEL
jgi:catechol 2,3-dioxygenase-like lactoylglutathione lyase family enzyme